MKPYYKKQNYNSKTYDYTSHVSFKNTDMQNKIIKALQNISKNKNNTH